MVETIFCITTCRSAVLPAGGAKQQLQQRRSNNLPEQLSLLRFSGNSKPDRWPTVMFYSVAGSTCLLARVDATTVLYLKGPKTRGRSECQTGEQRILSVLSSTVIEMQRRCGALGKVMIHNRFNLWASVVNGEGGDLVVKNFHNNVRW